MLVQTSLLVLSIGLNFLTHSLLGGISLDHRHICLPVIFGLLVYIINTHQPLVYQSIYLPSRVQW